LQQTRMFQLMNPLYIPFISYSKDLVENIIYTSLEYGIDIVFAPLFREPMELLIDFVKEGVIGVYNGVYRVCNCF